MHLYILTRGIKNKVDELGIMMKKIDVSVVVPVYKEKEIIKDL